MRDGDLGPRAGMGKDAQEHVHAQISSRAQVPGAHRTLVHCSEKTMSIFKPEGAPGLSSFVQ
jgi:hypothetical protein